MPSSTSIIAAPIMVLGRNALWILARRNYNPRFLENPIDSESCKAYYLLGPGAVPSGVTVPDEFAVKEMAVEIH